jgi:hypothetical protein
MRQDKQRHLREKNVTRKMNEWGKVQGGRGEGDEICARVGGRGLTDKVMRGTCKGTE